MLAVKKYTKFSAGRRYFGAELIFDPNVILTASVMIGSVITFYNRYRVSKPNQFLVKTGIGISDVIISKKSFQWPFQTYQFIDMSPMTLVTDLSVMSVEKLEYILPGILTVGPKDNIESLEKFSKLLPIGDPEFEQKAEIIIRGIFEGEMRSLCASLSMDQVFGDRKAFKDLLVSKMQEELDHFGLIIYNINIKDLHDSPGSEYFISLRQKKKSEAEAAAKINISESKKTGDIGHKQREVETRQRVAELEADTVLFENTKQQEIEKSKANLDVIKAEAYKLRELANTESKNAVLTRNAELQREVEAKTVAVVMEKKRSVDLTQAQVKAESQIKQAEGEATAARIAAEADLFTKEKQATGILALYKAQSEGVEKLITSFNNNPDLLMQYLMIDKGTYQELARVNSEAIKGLEPKITIWNTSSDANSDNYTKPISDILKMLPPLFTTINDQVGIKPANWMVNMPKTNNE